MSRKALILPFVLPRKRTMKQVIEGLSAGEARFTRPNGAVNAKQFAKAIGVSQPTISRAIRGGATYRPRDTLVEALVEYFGITPAQARGEDGYREKIQDNTLSHDARWIAEQADAYLTQEQKRALKHIVRSMIDAAPQRKAQ
jgi:transcriptional regulator with XRE-family HTH domain